MRCLSVITVLFLVACASHNNTDKIVFVYSKEAKCTMFVPKDYHFIRNEVTMEKEDRYLYEDSSYIYITSFDVSPNYNNINNLGDSVYAYRFQNRELYREINALLDKEYLKILPDTIELSGMNDKHLYWKDIKIKQITIGYDNVSENKKETYDKLLKSFKYTKIRGTGLKKNRRDH